MNLKDQHIIYFIGIGGIGMSALARYFHMLGMEVSGYDKTPGPITEGLSKEGISIHFEEDLSQVPQNADLVIFTPAVPDTHTELTWFRDNGYPVMKRAEVLGLISKDKKAIAIAGTHGKTTTTSILTHLLRVGGIDCTAFLGGIAANLNSNFVFGQSEWVVVEADEFDRSFLHLSPYYSAITSTDADHLDIYDNHETMLEGFAAFAEKVKPGGKVLIKQGLSIPLQDKDDSTFVENAYGLETGKNRATNIRVENGFFKFDFEGDINITDIQSPLPGRHNIENATAAISISLLLGVSPEDIRRAMASFKGIWRRFETIVRSDNFVYIDDYAHHPSELNAAISAAKELYPDKKVTGIFQPHLYSRTRDFSAEFAQALDQLDEVILMDIYPARELPIPGVTSDSLFELMKNPIKTRANKENLLQKLKLSAPEVLLTLGAGDIDRFVRPIKELFTTEKLKHI